ncbi:MAG: hypothetical protein ABUT20_50720, partial [Bacteroidota bacterium]
MKKFSVNIFLFNTNPAITQRKLKQPQQYKSLPVGRQVRRSAVPNGTFGRATMLGNVTDVGKNSRRF